MNGTQTVIVTDPMTAWIMNSQWAGYFVFGQIVVTGIIFLIVFGIIMGAFLNMRRRRW